MWKIYSLERARKLSAVFITFTLAALFLIATYGIKYYELCFKMSTCGENPEEVEANIKGIISFLWWKGQYVMRWSGSNAFSG